MVRGNPVDEATEVGPVIRPADADRIESWVKEAVEAGAKLVEGGGRMVRCWNRRS
jgi:acyl-CoA reductase-like NAD-dependent aldehyde dehydrogenase